MRGYILPVGPYDADLARIHDDGFGALAAAAGADLAAELAARGLRRATVVELGCGSGITAAALAEAGHDVHGIDSSQAMVDLARRRVPSGRFVVGAAQDVDLPGCDAVAAIGEVLNYATAEDPTGAVLRSVFDRVHAALRPGGLFMLDLAGPGRIPGGGPVRSHALGASWAILVEAEEDAQALTLERRMTTFTRAAGEGYRRAETVHRQRLHRSAPTLAALRAAGFTARPLRGYGGVRFAPGHRVYLARAAR